MTNVVPLKPRGQQHAPLPAAVARDTAALVADLVDLAEQIRVTSERAAALAHPGLRVERTVQCVLDAVTAIERAADALTDNGEYLPF